jgi:hypothetical protein
MRHPSEEWRWSGLAGFRASHARPGDEPDPVALAGPSRARRTAEQVLHEEADRVREAAVVRAIDPVPDARQEHLPSLRTVTRDSA